MNRNLTWIVFTIIFPALGFSQRHAYCNLRKSEKSGYCAFQTVFSYDTVLDECLPWDYSGCNIEGNMFRSYTDCRYHCVVRPSTIAWIKDHRCHLDIMEPDASESDCTGGYVWSFDWDLQECIGRHYQGCTVRGNMFSQKSDCVNFCQPLADVNYSSIAWKLEACFFPVSQALVRTKCEKGTEVFSYYSGRRRCEKSTYYGCEIRGNKFISLEDCKKKCAKNDVPSTLFR
ncbi:papilin-like isoform X1 [Drosophila willistoni]|uniref:papilin-like isoform X1 n=1 Tax=Drosophila willistoni TaxID=7260 RepID=UPI001F072B55|nr:papilin-like isoform X1 [Drosophila willistoni]